MRTGITELPLHHGSCPAWLFAKMKPLAKSITEVIVDEFGQKEFLKRISNPYFFQALGCVLGFDWHSSGLTTTTCGALKEALNSTQQGLFVCGGKGTVARKTPEEITQICDANDISSKCENLIKASKLSAKVDNSLIQDGYNLYHHVIIFTEKGDWAIIQQGMSESGWARRYHWLSDSVASFVEEPHTAICAQKTECEVLDMTAKVAREARKLSVDLVNDRDVLKLVNGQTKLTNFKVLHMPTSHFIRDMLKLNVKTLEKAAEIRPSNYEELIMVPGFGPKHVRALALTANLIYGSELSWKDPANYAFAHGGKDGIPFPVREDLYDNTIRVLDEAIKQAKIGQKEKIRALARLAKSWNGLQS